MSTHRGFAIYYWEDFADRHIKSSSSDARMSEERHHRLTLRLHTNHHTESEPMKITLLLTLSFLLINVFSSSALEEAKANPTEARLSAIEAQLERIEAMLQRFSPTLSAECQLGIQRYEQNRLDDAIYAFTRALAADPKNAIAHLYLSRAAEKKGWKEAAAKELAIAKSLDPAIDTTPEPNLGNTLKPLKKGDVPK